MVRVDITNPTQLLLIIKHKSGISYSNQVGGFACNQVEIEGSLIPLHTADLLTQLKKVSLNLYENMPEKLADLIDDLIQTEATQTEQYNCNEWMQGMKVDRSKLDQCQEAWIHIVATPGLSEADDFDSQVILDKEVDGVLSWENSD